MAKFRDYRDLEIPQVAIDLGFEDCSWHHDASARMDNAALNLELWVAEPDVLEREYPTQRRFSLASLEDKDTAFIFETESDEELRKFVEGYRPL